MNKIEDLKVGSRFIFRLDRDHWAIEEAVLVEMSPNKQAIKLHNARNGYYWISKEYFDKIILIDILKDIPSTVIGNI
jgi:hypothetical protein